MKRLVSIVLVATVLCSTMALCASSNGITPYVARRCPACGTSGAMDAYCGTLIGEYPDIECAMSTHTQPCVIMNRTKYSTLGTCSNSACDYYASKGAVYYYGEHVHSCMHSSTDYVVYNTCNF